MKLLDAPHKKPLLVTELNGSRALIHRLVSMGVVKGKIIELISHSKKGPVRIKVDSTRIGIGHDAAKHILVETINEDVNKDAASNS